MSEAFRSVSVYPTDPSRTETVEIYAYVTATSWEEAEAKLPSVETLTDLALDERLVPPLSEATAEHESTGSDLRAGALRHGTTRRPLNLSRGAGRR